LSPRSPSGSALVLSHATGEFDPEAARKGAEVYRRSGIGFQLRSREEVERFFAGLELVDPGVALIHRWHPDGADGMPRIGSTEVKDADVGGWAGVAFKP
jgi:hypothetical protein